MNPNQLRSTHTLAGLPLSQAAYDEIHAKLKAAGYDHAITDEGISLHGLMAQVDPDDGPRATELQRSRPDLIARGMAHADNVQLIKQVAAQAGVNIDEADAEAWNVCHRLALAVHKAGFNLALERVAQAMHLPPGVLLVPALITMFELLPAGWILQPPRRAKLTPAERTEGYGTSTLTDETPQGDTWHAAVQWAEFKHGVGG